jgi:hypothetical protein
MAERTLGRFGVPINGAASGMKQPVQKHRFRVLFSGFGEGGNTSNTISLETNTIALPNVTFEEQQVHGYNSRAYFAGKYEWAAVEMVVRDITDSSVLRSIASQQQKQFDHFQQVGVRAAASYKFTMTIQTMDGSVDGVISSWYVEGCFLQAINYGDNDYTASDARTISMTIRYDNATLDIGGVTVLNPGVTQFDVIN